MGVPEDLERGPIEVGAKTALEAINIYSEMKKASYTRILIIDDAGNLVDIRTLFDGI